MNLFNSKPYSLGKDDSEKATYTDNISSLRGFGRGEPKLPKSARVSIPIANIKGRPRPSDSSRGFAGSATLKTGFVKKNTLFDKNDPKRPKRTLIEVPYVLPANKAAILRAVKKSEGKSTSVLEDKLLRPATDIDYLEVLKLLIDASSGADKVDYQDTLRKFKTIIVRNKIREKRGQPISDEDQRQLSTLKNKIDEELLSVGEDIFKSFERDVLQPEREKADAEARAELEAELEQKAKIDAENKEFKEEQTRARSTTKLEDSMFGTLGTTIQKTPLKLSPLGEVKEGEDLSLFTYTKIDEKELKESVKDYVKDENADEVIAKIKSGDIDVVDDITKNGDIYIVFMNLSDKGVNTGNIGHYTDVLIDTLSRLMVQKDTSKGDEKKAIKERIAAITEGITKNASLEKDNIIGEAKRFADLVKARSVKAEPAAQEDDAKTVNLETGTVVNEDAPGLDRDAIVEFLKEFDKKSGEDGYLKNKELASKMQKDFKELYDRLSETNRNVSTNRGKTKEAIIKVITEDEERLQRRETARAAAAASAAPAPAAPAPAAAAPAAPVAVKQDGSGSGLRMHRGYETHGIYSTAPIRPRMKL